MKMSREMYVIHRLAPIIYHNNFIKFRFPNLNRMQNIFIAFWFLNIDSLVNYFFTRNPTSTDKHTQDTSYSYSSRIQLSFNIFKINLIYISSIYKHQQYIPKLQKTKKPHTQNQSNKQTNDVIYPLMSAPERYKVQPAYCRSLCSPIPKTVKIKDSQNPLLHEYLEHKKQIVTKEGTKTAEQKKKKNNTKLKQTETCAKQK